MNASPSNDLIARFLRVRWWEPLQELVKPSLDRGALCFDDLDLDQDIDELLRACSRADLHSFATSALLDSSLPSQLEEAFAPVSGSASEVECFLTIMGLNIALFQEPPYSWGAALTRVARGDDAFIQPQELGRLLARAGDPVDARGWLEAQRAEHEEAVGAALEACSAEPHGGARRALHIGGDLRSGQSALTEILERHGFRRRPWKQGDAASEADLKILVLPRVGRFVTLLLEGDGLEFGELAQALSADQRIQRSVLAEFGGPLRLEDYKKGRLSQDLLASIDPDLELSVRRAAMIGRLIAIGGRAYDRDAPRALPSLDFVALSPGGEHAGTARSLAFELHEDGPQPALRKRKRRREKRP